MIEAIIFDYDGVILNSFASALETYQKICKYFQLPSPATIEDFRKIYGYNYIECQYNLGLKKKDFSKVSEIYKQEMSQKQDRIFPGISRVIKKLAKKYKLYLVSSTYSTVVIPGLERFALKDLFENIYCGADQKIGKSYLLNNILRENKYLPSEVLSIGDRTIDYKVANEVGLSDNNIILVSYGWGFNNSEIGRANIADAPKDILNFIN